VLDYPSNSDDDFVNDANVADGESAIGVCESEDLASEADAEYTGPRCQKCAAPLELGVVTVCQKCGWYASLGVFVEVDQEWETALDDPAPTSHSPQTSHLRTWIELIPRWGWVIIGSVLVVVAESVAVRLATPTGGSLRTAWSLTQLAIGALVVICCHTFNFLSLAADDADVGLLDLLLKPIKLWLRTFHNLPRRLKLVNATACGLTAALMSLVVIGGIPYERLWDWGIKERPKQNLMGAVMDRMKELGSDKGSDNLEDAINDFAGSQGAAEETKPKPEPPKPREKADCLILGYQLDRDGRISTLLLGAAYQGKLVFAGRATPKLDDDESTALLKMLMSVATNKPLIRIPDEDARWVKPSCACRVTYAEQFNSGRFRDVQWDKLLGNMNVKR
jgi:ATP dependent DNA ligase C terminal region